MCSVAPRVAKGDEQKEKKIANIPVSWREANVLSIECAAEAGGTILNIQPSIKRRQGRMFSTCSAAGCECWCWCCCGCDAQAGVCVVRGAVWWVDSARAVYAFACVAGCSTYSGGRAGVSMVRSPECDALSILN